MPESKEGSCFSNRLSVGLLVCAAVVLVWFSPWWIGGRNLAPLDILSEMMQPWRGTDEKVSVKNHIVADAVDQYLVYRLVAEKSYQKEGWLGWSSLTYGGTAQYANTMALYYDWTMQLHRWFPFWTAWHLGLMGQVLLAAWGMLLFLRRRGIGGVWSICGALAYAANSQFVIWIYHRWALGAFCWVPWILWAVDSYRSGKRHVWVFVPLFTALALLGGTLQHGVFVGLAFAAAWMEEAVRNGRDRQRQSLILGNFAAWGLLGMGMATMMVLPCSDAFLASSKLGLHTGLDGNASMGIYPQGWLQPFFNLAAYPFQIFPSLLGRCGSLDVLKLFKSELLYIAYFGSLPVLVAFIAVFRKQTPLLARLLIAGGLLLPLTPLVRFLYQRLFLLFIFGGILAFTHFMESASRETKLRVAKITGGITATAILAWTALSVFFKLKEAWIVGLLEAKYLDSSRGTAFGYFREWMQGRFVSFTKDLCIWSPQQLYPLALFLIALAGLRLSAGMSPAWRNRGALMVATAVVLEVSLFGSRWVIFTDPAKAPLYPPTAESSALQRNAAEGRLITLNKEESGHMAVTPFVPNTLCAYGIATIQGYDSIVPNGMAARLDPKSGADVLGRLAISHLITYPGNAPGDETWSQIWDSPTMVLFENKAAIPRYIGLKNSADKEAFFRLTHSDRWQRLEETGHLENTRTIQVPEGTEWIRIAENHALGWEFRLASDKAAPWRPVERAADASMLLPLGPAASDRPVMVQMRYEPPLRRTGFILSGVSLLLTLGGGAVMLQRRSPAN